MLHRLWNLLFPPKCVLCRSILEKQETDLCRNCRDRTDEAGKGKFKLSFVARWAAVWYYKDTVRGSILRFKFGNRRSYAQCYGRLLAMQLHKQNMTDFDVLTWVPVSALRRFTRGYDQCQLLALAVANELGVEAVSTLRKKNIPSQSTLHSAAARRANVLGAYRVIQPDLLAGKRVLLLDDIITTGATISECARELLTAGASEVICGAVAVAAHNKTK